MKKEVAAQEFGPGFVLDLDDPGYPLPEGIIVKKDVPIEMRDGLKLAANVYRPDKPGKFPVIMSFTIYGKDLSGWGKARFIPSHRISRETAFEAVDPGFWVPYDYVVILSTQEDLAGHQEVRGRNTTTMMLSSGRGDKSGLMGMWVYAAFLTLP